MNNKLPRFNVLILNLEDALISKDLTKILDILGQLARDGNPTRFYEIGHFYEAGGDRISPNNDLAFFWYKKSAYEQIDRDGYFGLGRFYFYGKHVERNLHEASAYFQEAFNLGSVDAAVMKGYCEYLIGNLAEAEKYLTVGLEHGFPVAMYFLHKIASRKRRYISSAKLWFACMLSLKRLSRSDPESPKLLFLHGIWKIYK